jgi:hypothetical protein|nr:MAG TPA: hypothetical protein [Caudoviricetes sp.]
MNLINKYLKQRRGEFVVNLRADIVQAIADGKYIADPSNEHKEWIEQMKGQPFIHVMESMADLVADHMRETYGVPPFMAAVDYNEDVATIFDDYEKAIRALKRFDMPTVYKGHMPEHVKSESLCIGVSDGEPLWFLYRDRIRSRKLALACQYAWPEASDNSFLDFLIVTEGGKWRDLNDIVNGGILGVVLNDTKKNLIAAAMSGLRYETVKSAKDDRSYIVVTAVHLHHDYDLILDRVMSIVGGLYIPSESNKEEDEE